MKKQCTQEEMHRFLFDYRGSGEAMISKIRKGVEGDAPYTVWVKVDRGNQIELCGRDENSGSHFINTEHLAGVK